MADRKDFIIKHMNADHQKSLSLYLQVYCQISSSAAKSPRLEDVRLTDMAISAQGTRYSIPFNPPMKSLTETRARVVAMHKECLQRLDLSDIIIKEYIPPRGFQIFGFTMCLAAYVAFSCRANFLPGSLLYETLALHRFPAFTGFAYKCQPLLLGTLAGLHLLEATVLLAWKRLRKHGVPLFSGLWWAWVVTCVIEGFPTWQRFDRLVRKKEGEGEHAKAS